MPKSRLAIAKLQATFFNFHDLLYSPNLWSLYALIEYHIPKTANRGQHNIAADDACVEFQVQYRASGGEFCFLRSDSPEVPGIAAG